MCSAHWLFSVVNFCLLVVGVTSSEGILVLWTFGVLALR